VPNAETVRFISIVFVSVSFIFRENKTVHSFVQQKTGNAGATEQTLTGYRSGRTADLFHAIYRFSVVDA
jgi:hypothetical protein